jgi:hypothetical protein
MRSAPCPYCASHITALCPYDSWGCQVVGFRALDDHMDEHDYVKLLSLLLQMIISSCHSGLLIMPHVTLYTMQCVIAYCQL